MRMVARVSLIRSANGAPADWATVRAGRHRSLAEFSPAQVIVSVTSLAAQSCGIGDRKGISAGGYEADLRAVVGDPEKGL